MPSYEDTSSTRVSLVNVWNLNSVRNTWQGERAYFRPGREVSFSRNAMEYAAEKQRTRGTWFTLESSPALLVEVGGHRFAAASGERLIDRSGREFLESLRSASPDSWTRKLSRSKRNPAWLMDVDEGDRPERYSPMAFHSRTQGPDLPLLWEPVSEPGTRFLPFLDFAKSIVG